MSEQWKHDEALRASAERYIADVGLTRGEFTVKLGRTFSPTRIAKYLNLNKSGAMAEPDMPKVETAVRQYLRHVNRTNTLRQNLFKNSVSDDVVSVLRQIRRTGDIGVIHSDAGEGKTSGALIYCQENPNTIYTRARKPYACSDNALLRMIRDEYLEGSDEIYDGPCDGLWLEKHLRGSERLCIIDDGELLHMSAVKAAISIHDATGLAIAFIANDEFIQKLINADPSGKLISRIGIRHQVRQGNDEEETAKKLIQQFAPDSGDELVDQVVTTMSQFGHKRRVRKQLILGANIYQGSREKDWQKSYAAAGVKMVNPTKVKP